MLKKLSLLFVLCATAACSEAPPPTQPVQLTSQENFYLKEYISNCWQNDDLDAPVVHVYLSFYPSGHIHDIYVVPEQLDRYDTDKEFRETADKVLMGLKRCDPFYFLPREKYDSWKEMVLTFDPKKG